MVTLTEQVANPPEKEKGQGEDGSIAYRRYEYYRNRAIEELPPAVAEVFVPQSEGLLRACAYHSQLYEKARHTPEAIYLLKNQFLEITPQKDPRRDGMVFRTSFQQLTLFQENHREPKYLPHYWLLLTAYAYDGTPPLLPGSYAHYQPAYFGSSHPHTIQGAITSYFEHIYYVAASRSGIHLLDAQIPRSFNQITPEFITAYSQAAKSYQTEITCERMRSAMETPAVYDTRIKKAYHIARTPGYRDKERILFGTQATQYFHRENNLTSPICLLFNQQSDLQTALETDPQDPAIPFKFFKCLAPAFMPFDKVTLTANDLGRAILDRYLHDGADKHHRVSRQRHPLHPYRSGHSTTHTELFYRFATQPVLQDTTPAGWTDAIMIDLNHNEIYELVPNTQYLGTSRLVIVPQPAWQTFHPAFWRDQIINHLDARLLHCLAQGDGTYFHTPAKLLEQKPILSALYKARHQAGTKPTTAKSTANTTEAQKPKPRTTVIVDDANTKLIQEGQNQLSIYTGPPIQFPDEDVDVHIRISQVYIEQAIHTQGNLIFDAPFPCALFTHRVNVSSILQEEKPEPGQKHTLSASHDIIVACSLQAMDLVINTLQNIEVDGDLWCSAVKADGNIHVSEHLMAAEIHSGGCVEANRITAPEIIGADRIFARTEIRATMIRSLECFAASGLKVPPQFEDPTGRMSKGVDANIAVG